MATLTGDEEVAAALEASARRAELRAGHSSAATAYLRAAELSTDDARRVRRIAAAAHAAWAAGQPDRARDIIGRALPLAVGQTRTELLHLSGLIEEHTGSVREAFALPSSASRPEPNWCATACLTRAPASPRPAGASAPPPPGEEPAHPVPPPELATSPMRPAARAGIVGICEPALLDLLAATMRCGS